VPGSRAGCAESRSAAVEDRIRSPLQPAGGRGRGPLGSTSPRSGPGPRVPRVESLPGRDLGSAWRVEARVQLAAVRCRAQGPGRLPSRRLWSRLSGGRRRCPASWSRSGGGGRWLRPCAAFCRSCLYRRLCCRSNPEAAVPKRRGEVEAQSRGALAHPPNQIKSCRVRVLIFTQRVSISVRLRRAFHIGAYATNSGTLCRCGAACSGGVVASNKISGSTSQVN
jgi:hypothetical protein